MAGLVVKAVGIGDDDDGGRGWGCDGDDANVVMMVCWLVGLAIQWFRSINRHPYASFTTPLTPHCSHQLPSLFPPRTFATAMAESRVLQ